MTWSKLIHPHIVQFLGVYFLSGSRVPMLILEKMDISLRHYLENHAKENFVLPKKIYVLRQVAQALSYLHSRSPPLVHHDLSPNNVLLNKVSLQAKVTDFGMTRAMDPSKMTRKSSAKGTQAFMPPEALHSPPRYDEKLDVFSYGNVIVTMVIHDWPEPGPPTKYEGDKLIALTELQRREQYLNRFNQTENNLFLPIVSSCLENRPHQRPSSFNLVTRMREIEESHPRVTANSSSTAPFGRDPSHLHQEFTIKENTIHQKDTQLKQKDVQLRLKNAQLQQKDAQLQQKDAQLRELHAELKQQHTLVQQKDSQLKQKDAELRHNDEESGRQYAVLLHEHQQLQRERDQLRHERLQLQQESSHSLSVKPVSCSHLFVSLIHRTLHHNSLSLSFTQWFVLQSPTHSTTVTVTLPLVGGIVTISPQTTSHSA